MHTMSADQQQPQQNYYSNPVASHQPVAPIFYSQPTMDPQQYQAQMRPGHQYATRMGAPQQFIAQQIPNAYANQFFPHPGFMPQLPPGNNARPMNTQYVSVNRQSNDAMNYMQQPAYSAYPNANLSAGGTMYPGPQFFPNGFALPQGYAAQQSPLPQQMSNQAPLAQTPPYSIPQNIAQQPTIHTAPPVQHAQIDPSHVPPPQATVMPQSAPFVPAERRRKTPLAIVDPVSHKQVEVDVKPPPSSSSSTTNIVSSASTTNTADNRPTDSSTDSSTTNAKSTEDMSKTQIQADFRRQFAVALGDASAAQTDKTVSQASTTSVPNDEPPVPPSAKAPALKPVESLVVQSTSSASSSRSGSISRTKSPTPVSSTTASKESTSSHSSEKPQPGYPGIRTGTMPEESLNSKTHQDANKDTRERSNSQKQLADYEVIEPLERTNSKSTSHDVPSKPDEDTSHSSTIENRPTPLLSATESLECVTPPQTPTPLVNTERSQSTVPNQRLRYKRDELLRIRDNPSSSSIPANLPNLDIIINPRENARSSYPNTAYTGTNSHGRLNPQFNRQSSTSNHPSLTRFQNAQSNNSNDSKRKPGIYLPQEPDFTNRVENPYKPIDQNKLDVNLKVLRDIKAILNKVTPQTYDKLQKQLEALEVDRYERLEGMITIFFSKAVDEPAFSFLYARLCKQFQKKQVTVPGEDGKTVTHYFRQILLTRCQKEFENDYRQEIEYERRKKEVEAIPDEKKRKDDSEKLEEDLVKAKRRKLGNIFFIGELFKLQMLTDTIMYDCIEYLLRDKTDEESLECLCRLLRTIGKELEGKAGEKTFNKNNLEKHYRELENITKETRTSARIRFMIQDLMELRQAAWVARRVEAKPTTIDEIHEQERLKREQQERDIERDRMQRRDQNRGTVIGSNYSGNNQQQYNDSRGSRGSGIKQQGGRNDDDRVENRFDVNTLRQMQSSDKRNQGPIAMSLAPQRTWAKGSGIEKKPEEDRTFVGRKPPAGPVQQLKGKSTSSQGGSGYPLQRQSSRELAREYSLRDRENALQSLRKTTTGPGPNSPSHTAGSSSITNSREGSRNVSREQSRNASRESSVSERASIASLTTQMSKTSVNDSSIIINQDTSDTSFDEDKTITRVRSLKEEYTENYSESSDQPVKEALEDLAAFRTSSPQQQAIIVRELFNNVLEDKPRARKAVGHLLNAAVTDEILSNDAFLSGLKMLFDMVPDYAVDIPLIWQYIGEILGAFIGAPSSNMFLLKSIVQYAPQDKATCLFQYIIRYAAEFSSKARLQSYWQQSGLSLNDVLQTDQLDSSFEREYEWLTDASDAEMMLQSKENHSPHSDPHLVKLFKSVNDANTTVTDSEILNHIRDRMDPNEKFYIRNIVLSYLEACLINRDPQKKIQEDIAKKRMTVLNSIIQHKPEAEIQAVYAIQNFVSKLEHPPKMARLLFDIFYDEECVSEDAFFEWLKHPDQSETEGHAVVEMSTKDFFTWLQQAETEVEEGEEEES